MGQKIFFRNYNPHSPFHLSTLKGNITKSSGSCHAHSFIWNQRLSPNHKINQIEFYHSKSFGWSFGNTELNILKIFTRWKSISHSETSFYQVKTESIFSLKTVKTGFLFLCYLQYLQNAGMIIGSGFPANHWTCSLILGLNLYMYSEYISWYLKTACGYFRMWYQIFGYRISLHSRVVIK